VAQGERRVVAGVLARMRIMCGDDALKLGLLAPTDTQSVRRA